MAEGRGTPHILVEADIGLTDWLVERLRGAEEPTALPFLFSFSWMRNAFRNTADREAADRNSTGQQVTLQRRCLHFVPLIRHLLAIGNDKRDLQKDEDFFEAFVEELANIRTHFGLDDGQLLKVVVVGSHSSISDNLKLCDTRIEDSAVGYEAWRANRQLAGKLGAALDQVDGLQLEWLSEVAPDLCPRESTSNSDFLTLAAAARDYLSRIDANERGDEDGDATKPGARPLIYARDGPNTPWRRFGDGDGYHMWRTTLRLITEFARAKEESPNLEGILVKVLPTDVSDRNVVDAVMLTAEQHKGAMTAGLSTILLDRRYGVVCPDSGNGLPVYAV